MLTNLYTSNKGGGGGGGGGKNQQQTVDGEVIGISSDEDSSSEDEPSGKNKQNSKSIGNQHQILMSKVLNDKIKSSANDNTKRNNSDDVHPIKRRKLENNNAMNVNNTKLLSKNDKLSIGSNGQIDGNRDSTTTPYVKVTRTNKLQQQQQQQHQESQRRPLTGQIGREITIQPVRKISSNELSTKKFKREVTATTSPITFEDLGGMDKTLIDLCELLLHIKHPEVYKHIGLPPSRGFLLHGPPGSGKTLLAQAIAGQLNIGLIQLTATELIAGVSGESEELIRELFEQAAILAPCVLFIDEIDAISSNRMNAQKDMERRIVSQLLSSFDGLSKFDGGDQVLVIGATNRPDTLDPALRRVGRFDQEISLGIPDRSARSDILKVICSNLKLEFPFKFDELAALTPGYVGADLVALATRAASLAVKRTFAKKQEQAIRQNVQGNNDFSMKMSKQFVNDILELDFGSDAESVVDKTKEKPNGKDEPTIDISDDTLPEDKIVSSVTTTTEPPTNDEKTVECSENESSIKQKENNDDKVIGDKTPTEETGKDLETKENNAVDTLNDNKETIDDKSEKVDEKMVTESKTADEQSTSQTETAEPMAVDDTAADSANPDDTKKTETTESAEQKITNCSSADTNQMEVEPVEKPKEISVVESTLLPCATVSPMPTIVVASSKSKSKNGNNEVIEIDEEDSSLTDALLKDGSVRLALGLNVMIQWLSDTYPTISPNELANINITMADFIEAIGLVQPSAKREGFITVPDVTWNDIGSLRDIRDELQLAILAPVKYPKQMESLGLYAPSGVLLCGPPGCGKTLLAKAVANEAGINFISVKGPELLNMYVGESERAVRQCFQRARNSAPCVIFFDEFDALCPKRSDSGEVFLIYFHLFRCFMFFFYLFLKNNATSRVVNQLLTEMDGIDGRKGVYLMAATNRPDIVDPAVMRPGRFDKVLYVGMPNEKDRAEILRALTKVNFSFGFYFCFTWILTFFLLKIKEKYQVTFS